MCHLIGNAYIPRKVALILLGVIGFLLKLGVWLKHLNHVMWQRVDKQKRKLAIYHNFRIYLHFTMSEVIYIFPLNPNSNEIPGIYTIYIAHCIHTNIHIYLHNIQTFGFFVVFIVFLIMFSIAKVIIQACHHLQIMIESI